MKNNTDLNEENLDVFANAAVQYNIEKQLRSRYDKLLADNHFNGEHKESTFRFLSIAKAAAVLTAIFGCIYLIQILAPHSSAQVMAQNFLDQTNIASNPDITRKGTSNANQLRREANDAYTLKNYPLAIEKYDALNSQNELIALDQFYLGISHLKTDDFNAAINIFSEIKSSEKIETQEMNWLLSLAFVLSKQEDKAVPLLENIIADKKYKSKEAEKLLKTIE